MEDQHMTTQKQRDAEYRAALGLSEGDPLPKAIGSGGGAGHRSNQRRQGVVTRQRGAKVVGAGDATSIYADEEADRG